VVISYKSTDLNSVRVSVHPLLINSAYVGLSNFSLHYRYYRYIWSTTFSSLLRSHVQYPLPRLWLQDIKTIMSVSLKRRELQPGNLRSMISQHISIFTQGYVKRVFNLCILYSCHLTTVLEPSDFKLIPLYFVQ
jgi:hypothetical protein